MRTTRGNVIIQGMPLLDRQPEEIFFTLERVDLHGAPLSNEQPTEAAVCKCGRNIRPYVVLSKCETYCLTFLFILISIVVIWTLCFLLAVNKKILLGNCLN